MVVQVLLPLFVSKRTMLTKYYLIEGGYHFHHEAHCSLFIEFVTLFEIIILFEYYKINF